MRMGIKIFNGEVRKMEELEKLVHELEELDEESKIIGKLQEIGSKLLTEYEIKIDDALTILPLRVEAYYFRPQRFEDNNCHNRTPENFSKTKFGRWYEHHDGRGGFDLGFSCGEYSLSFLIKNSKAKENPNHLIKQIEFADVLKKHGVGQGTPVTLIKSPKDNVVLFTARKGLTKVMLIEKEQPLGMLIELKEHSKGDSCDKYDFETGWGKENIVRFYISEKMKSASLEEKQNFCKEQLGYVLKKLEF